MKTRNNISPIRNLYLPLTIALLAFVMPACDTTDSGSEEEKRFKDGINVEIIELLGEDLLNTIENEMEIPIHRGDNPPNIVAMLSEETSSKEIIIVMKPYDLLSTTVPGDGRLPGDKFLDLYLRFSSQDMEDYTLTMDLTHPGRAPSIGPGSFIIGDGNKFTVFGPTKRQMEGGTVLSTDVFSGVITDKGISSPYHALILVDDDGVSDLIPEGTGRSFIDGDGTAEVTQWPESVPTRQQAPDMIENYRIYNSEKQ